MLTVLIANLHLDTVDTDTLDQALEILRPVPNDQPARALSNLSAREHVFCIALMPNRCFDLFECVNANDVAEKLQLLSDGEFRGLAWYVGDADQMWFLLEPAAGHG